MDPCTGNTMVVIRNPKIKIKPYTSMEGVIDISEHVARQRSPVFFKAEQRVSFTDEKIGWHTMLKLIKSKECDRQFWDFIEGLRHVRNTYNQLLLSKYRQLSRLLKRDPLIV